MEYIRNSMDLRAKEKHEEEHEDSKKIETRTTSPCIKESQDYQPDMNSLKAIKQRN
jgi:hypothetical protein